jgi:hypothetical protein
VSIEDVMEMLKLTNPDEDIRKEASWRNRETILEDLRWAQYGTDPQIDKSRGDKIMKVFTVVYTAAAGGVATLMRDGQAMARGGSCSFATLADGQAWHGAAAAALPHWLTWTSLEVRGFVLLRRGASL